MTAGLEAGGRQARLVFGGDLDTEHWRRRHAAGEVPDALPYGLDRLQGHGWTPRTDAGGWAASRPGRVVRGTVRKAGGGYDWALAATARPRADVVVSWDERAGAPLAAAHGRRTPVVSNVVWATDAAPRRAVAQAVGAGLRACAAVFLHSSAQVPALVSTFGLDAARVHPIAFGVDAGFFTPTREDDVDPDLVIAVGNDRHRDWPTALAAFDLVRAQRPATRLLVVSGTVDRSLLAGRPGVGHEPSLRHDVLASRLAHARVAMVLSAPNLHVSGATAMLEAFACGRPVVATANPGAQDYSAAGGGLCTVAPGDARAAADALLVHLTDADGAAQAGAQGRAAVEAVFSTEHHAQRLARVLDLAVQGR